MGSSARRRVAVWGTGGVGAIAVRSAHARPDMDLCGVWVHSPEKDGRDAGELVGIDPIGLAASGDAEALLALDLDCVIYTASGPDLDAVAVPDYERMLRAGIDVVTVTSPGLVYPAAFDAATVARLTEAAEAGGASLYASGVEPGFAADQLPLTLLTLSDTVRQVRTQEIFLYDEYPVEFMMREVFGFGKGLDHQPIMAMDGVQSGTWGPPVRMVADALGVELDAVRETYERVLTPRRLEVACGVIDEGTVGAVRFETIGVVDGSDAIVIEHVNRMAADLAPEWATAERDGTYRLLVEGEPSFSCELVFGGVGTSSAEGMVATAMRIVNAVPGVCDAAPGLVSSLDLPLTLPVDPFRSPSGHPR
jgi:2,4-diaminopentanoate dehydrogenase